MSTIRTARVITLLLSILLVMLPINSEALKSSPPMRIGMWREPTAEVKGGSLGSVLVDQGLLTAAMPNNDGYYVFSADNSVGAKPLVLIGNRMEILEFFAEHPSIGIQSKIQELPNIYMGISKYKPGKRFTGLFPVHGFMAQLVEGLAGFVPGTQVTDVAGNIKDLAGYLKYIKADRYMKSKKSKDASSLLYLKFDYLGADKGMEKIGQREVKFADLLQRFCEGVSHRVCTKLK